MVTENIKKLQALQAQTAELSAAIDKERTLELAELPSRYGYDSLPAFIKAVKAAAASGKRGRGKGRKAKTAGKATAKAATAKGGKRKRARITDEVKAAVKAAVVAGKSGSAIAKEFGISAPSVQNIKKEFGLVKTRGAAAPASV
jgi:hypothetical protein